MDHRPQVRISDRDRQAAADRLLAAQNEGRIDLFEYDRRLGEAYRAVTGADPDRLFDDLPARPAPAPRAATRARSTGVPKPLKVLWTVWLSILSVNVVVWALVCLSNATLVYLWPIWLCVPGAALLAVTAGVAWSRSS